MTESIAPFAVTFAWQSTVVLGAAAVNSTLLRRPAIANMVVIVGLIATIACAIGSFVVHRSGAGVLPARRAARPVEMVAPIVPSTEPPASAAAAGIDTDDSGPVEATDTATGSRVSPVGHALPRVAFPELMLGAWGLASLLLASRAALRASFEWRVVRHARTVTDADANALAAEVADTLGVCRAVLVQAPNGVGPALWGWARRPTVILPPETLASCEAELRGILSHELAHWRRWDHAWALFASLIVIAMPWQPFAWWCRQRLTATSEQACDAWALALGSNPRSYAEGLMRLATQRSARLALSAVGSRSRLHRRVRHILAGRGPDPRLAFRPVVAAALTAAATVVSISLAQPGPMQAEDDVPQVLDWMRRTAIPLETAEIDRFGDLVGNARVVAMGTSAPGSLEMFQIRRRLLEYLVRERGYTALVLGTSFADCLALDTYVADGQGDPEAALHDQGYWTYDTKTVLDTVEWLRGHNARQPSDRTVHMYGVDMQQAGPALDTAARALRPFAPDDVDTLLRLLEPLRNHVAIIDSYEDLSPAARDELRSTANRLVELFDTHRQAITDATSHRAWATARQHAVVVRQCGEWVRAHHAWLPPIGRRAFLELWGRTETATPALIAFIEACDPQYAQTVTEQMRSLADDPYWTGRRLAADSKGRQLGRKLVRRLGAMRQEYESRTSPAEWQAARSAAETLAAWLAACETLPEATADEPSIVRNRSMAANVAWVLEQSGSGTKVVMWEHNDSVARRRSPGTADGAMTLGDALAQRFGADCRTIAVSFGRGSILAIHSPIEWDPAFVQRLGAHTLAGPAPTQFEALLLQVGLPAFALDLTGQVPDGSTRAWLSRPHAMWSIGSGYAREREIRGDYSVDVTLPEHFDAIVFVASTTPSDPNARTRQRFAMDD